MDKHFHRTRPQRYHNNRREGNQCFPGINASGWTLKEIREFVRGRRDRRDDEGDDAEEVHHDNE